MFRFCGSEGRPVRRPRPPFVKLNLSDGECDYVRYDDMSSYIELALNPNIVYRLQGKFINLGPGRAVKLTTKAIANPGNGKHLPYSFHSAAGSRGSECLVPLRTTSPLVLVTLPKLPYVLTMRRLAGETTQMKIQRGRGGGYPEAEEEEARHDRSEREKEKGALNDPACPGRKNLCLASYNTNPGRRTTRFHRTSIAEREKERGRGARVLI